MLTWVLCDGPSPHNAGKRWVAGVPQREAWSGNRIEDLSAN